MNVKASVINEIKKFHIGLQCPKCGVETYRLFEGHDPPDKIQTSCINCHVSLEVEVR